MMNVFSDADRTSVAWIGPGSVDAILADSWRSRISTKRGKYRSDAETSSAVFKGSNQTLSVVAFAVMAFILFLLNKRKEGETAGACEKSGRDDIALRAIRAQLANLANLDLRSRAEDVIAKLAGVIGGMDDLPMPSVSLTEDGAFVLEWTRGLSRVGINIEPNASDSGWYFVSLTPGAQGSASGTIDSLDPVELFGRLATP